MRSEARLKISSGKGRGYVAIDEDRGLEAFARRLVLGG